MTFAFSQIPLAEEKEQIYQIEGIQLQTTGEHQGNVLYTRDQSDGSYLMMQFQFLRHTCIHDRWIAHSLAVIQRARRRGGLSQSRSTKLKDATGPITLCGTNRYSK